MRLGKLSGKKYDDGKPPMALLPGGALLEVARVLRFGAGKYKPRYDVAVGNVRIQLKADVATFEVQFDFSTGLAPAEVK